MRNDHLGIGLSSKSSRLKKGLLVPDTSLIDILTSLDVVNSVDHEAQGVPEPVIKDVLSVRTHVFLEVSGSQVLVHELTNLKGGSGLGGSNVILSEEELSVQVRDFNIVIVGAGDESFGSTTNSHHGVSLDELASKSSGSDHEDVEVSELLLDLITKDGDLVVVSCAVEVSVNLFSWESDELFEVEELSDRSVLSSDLDNFLSSDSSKEGSLR